MAWSTDVPAAALSLSRSRSPRFVSICGKVIDSSMVPPYLTSCARRVATEVDTSKHWHLASPSITAPFPQGNRAVAPDHVAYDGGLSPPRVNGLGPSRPRSPP